VVKVSIVNTEKLACILGRKAYCHANSRTTALVLIAGAGNKGGGRKPELIESKKIEFFFFECNGVGFTVKICISSKAYNLILIQSTVKPCKHTGSTFLETNDVRTFLANLVGDIGSTVKEIVCSVRYRFASQIKSNYREIHNIYLL
jgi:hypothetical protein